MTPHNAAKPEDFTHSWLLCRETGEVAINTKSPPEPRCPKHGDAVCLAIYVPIEEVAA